MGKQMRYSCIAVCVCLLAVVCLGIALRDSPEASAAEYLAKQTLAELGVTDVVFVEKADAPGESEGEYLLYINEEEQSEYYFDVESGRLTRVKNHHLAKSESEMSDASERYSLLLEFAADCLGADLIGELKLESTNGESGEIYMYTINEYYDGLPTGSSVMVNYQEGVVSWSLVTTGGIFTRDAQGNLVLTNGDGWLDAGQALDIALAYLHERGTEEAQEVKTEEAVCSELQASGDELSYWVDVPFVDANGWQRTYGFRINAYTGEIIRATLSK